MKIFIGELLIALLGRSFLYRIGRALYQKARGDIVNDMKSNGEIFIQNCVVDHWEQGEFKDQRLVVFDVGANVGDWSSALMSRLIDSSLDKVTDIYIFEPVPSTFVGLKSRLGTENSALNYHAAALSSETCQSVMYVSAVNAGTNSLYSSSRTKNETAITIDKYTAADFCTNHQIEHIHLLKCDTEGHDMEVIRGALPLLVDEKISVLQFEYNHRWIAARDFLRDVFMSVEKLPYRVVLLQPNGLWMFSEWHPELERFFEANYALVHVDALEWFPIKKVSWDCYNTMSVELH